MIFLSTHVKIGTIVLSRVNVFLTYFSFISVFRKNSRLSINHINRVNQLMHNELLIN